MDERRRLQLKRAKKKYITKQRTNIRAFVDALKARPCQDCDESYPSYVMEFDHVRGEKRFNLGRVTWIVGHLGAKWREVVLAEAAKCDVLCSNCHRERTHRRRLLGHA